MEIFEGSIVSDVIASTVVNVEVNATPRGVPFVPRTDGEIVTM